MRTPGPTPNGPAATSRGTVLLAGGASRACPYETATASRRPGDTVLLVSDGVTEAIDPRGDLFDTPRVTALVADAGLSAP